MASQSSKITPLDPPALSSAREATRWQIPPGSADALTMARLADADTGPLLIITPDSNSAQRMYDALRFYSDRDVLFFPDWETLPYDSFSPHQDIVSQRLRTLRELQKLESGAVLVPINTLMQRLSPADYVAVQALHLEVGMKLDRQHFRDQLHRTGYRAVETVFEPGEYAFRGALIDLYPVGSARPLRIDLFDDELDTLRTFDPDTQRSDERIERIELLPAHEYPLTPEAIARFREGFETLFDVDPRQCPLYLDALQGIPSPGLEQYLPLFFETTDTLLSHLGGECRCALLPGVYEAAEAHWRSINDRFENLGVDPTRPLLSPARAFVPVAELFGQINRYPRLQWRSDREGREVDARALPRVAIDARASAPLAPLETFLADNPSLRVLFVAESRGRREALEETLAPLRLGLAASAGWESFAAGDSRYALTEGGVDRGLWLADDRLLVLTESELYGEVVHQSRRRSRATDDAEMAVRHLSELREGAPVVHQTHGVGRYLGLETLHAGGMPAEFLTLEYAGGARLYVPVDSLHLISRYAGASDESAPLHKLGSDQWDKARRRAAEKVRDSAAELLDIYARREARQGYACDPPGEEYNRFAAGFPFEETPDQRMAIDAVIHDMTSTQPMDRVVCGDVGFGKTEVAMRAAFMAVQSGRQVAVLVPTTLLAQQHLDNFRDRFAGTAVNIDILSRFQGGRLQAQTLERLGDGQVDIVIGTHKLLGREMAFANLGLVIVDEEHRFGVNQKEKLKALRAEVDILTLTATPIPRTLSMAMSGMRDLSIIATPPARRLSVKTFVQQRNPSVLKEAVLRELLRGGQVYYLHNEVKSIEATAEKVRELVPDARVGVAHGQMTERSLERAMSDFYHKRYNVLVCSTIIETGIDVPSANTIIIERADRFGLAQLHQLRGRVGRSHHQAYAYLLTPPPRQMTADAAKRLEAISQAEDLGAGFTLASHDLEIRGAGELLGEEQSGQIESIGYSLYMEMLDRAVNAIRNGKTPNVEAPMAESIEIGLGVAALIPDDYIQDVQQRLIMYKRVSNARSDDELRELQVEMIDRFGLLPEPAKHLFRQASLRLRAESLGITRLEAGDKRGRIQFGEETAVEPITLVEMIQKAPGTYRLDGADTLRFEKPMADAEARFGELESLLDRFNRKAQAA